MNYLSDVELKLLVEDSQREQGSPSRDLRVRRVVDELLFIRCELEKRNEQVAHLQNRGTELINETRMLKAKLHAARRILTYHLIEHPIDELGGALPPQSGALMTLYKRLDILENTVASKIATVAGEFVRDARFQIFKPVSDEIAASEILTPADKHRAAEENYQSLLSRFADRFAAILDA